MEKRGWSAAALTDLKFIEDGVREYESGSQKWTIIIQGKVGIALDEQFTEKWRKGGATTFHAKEFGGTPSRSIAVSIPSEGWKKGWFIISTYAPTSKRTELRAREHFLEQIERIAGHAKGYQTTVIMGDFNASVGARKDEEYRDVMGEHGNNHRTESGANLLSWCRSNSYIIAGTYTRQKERATWWHPRWGTGHELDHCILKRQDRWMLTKCSVIHHSGTNHEATWKVYTDHEPVEMELRTAKNWVEAKQERKREERPAFERLLGTSEAAESNRTSFERVISDKVEAEEEKQEDLDWTKYAESHTRRPWKY